LHEHLIIYVQFNLVGELYCSV